MSQALDVQCASCGHGRSEHGPSRRDGTGPLHCFHADDVMIADGPDYDNDWCPCEAFQH